MKKEKIIKVKIQKDYELVRPHKREKSNIRVRQILNKMNLSYFDYLFLIQHDFLTYIRRSKHVTLAKYGSIYFLTLFKEDYDKENLYEWYSTQNLGKIPTDVALKIFKETKAEYG